MSLPGLLDHSNVYHVCLSVDDVPQAMAELTSLRGYSWAPVEDWELAAWVPGSEPTRLVSTTTYSVKGPVHIELTHFRSGPVPTSHDLVTPHHVGYWSDDVLATTEELVTAGWTLEFSVGRVGGVPVASVLRAPSGYRIELVPTSSKPRHEAWLASGPAASS